MERLEHLALQTPHLTTLDGKHAPGSHGAGGLVQHTHIGSLLHLVAEWSAKVCKGLRKQDRLIPCKTTSPKYLHDPLTGG
jgi:hypothetical protein